MVQVKKAKVPQPVVHAKKEDISGPDDKAEAEGDDDVDEDEKDDKGVRRRRRDT